MQNFLVFLRIFCIKPVEELPQIGKENKMSNNFEYYAPTKVVFGRGAEKQVGELIKQFGGHKVLIHYGGGSVVRSGILDKVKHSIGEAGLEHVELGGVVPNPRLSKVYEGIELAKGEGVDFLLAVGGGSVIDSAKAIAYGIANKGDVWDFYDHNRNAVACAPVGSVLTIAAAGSEMSRGSVITKEEGNLKRAYDDDLARPKFAVMNPEFTMTLPDYQTESGCTDIMMHTMERYFTNGGNMEITDIIAEGLLRTVMANANILHRDPSNYEARAEVMWSGSLSHNDLTSCGNDGGDFATHMLEHELGGMFDVAHGAGLAAVWGSWARYVYKNAMPRFVRYAVNVMGVTPQPTDEETALKGIEAMEGFYRSIGMPTSIKELGVEATDEQLRTMAHMCAVATGGSIGSAKVLKEEDMYLIYKAAANR